jgi:flagellar basal-body rod modification protein FlgD
MAQSVNFLPTDNTASQITGAQSKQLGKEDFLKLLVAQLSTQDPLNPVEGQEFTAQLAQFSSLEQMSNVNKNLEEIQKFNVSMVNSSALDLIGKKVNAPGNTFDHNAGETSALSFNLGGEAASVAIDVFDSTGLKVDSIKLTQQSAGLQTAVWDGTDKSGKLLPKGNYSFAVAAEDSVGNVVPTELFSSGLVKDVILENDKAYAVVNGQKLETKDITKISINQ